MENIFMPGKDTTVDKLKEFIVQTIHVPTKLTINRNQIDMLRY